MLEIGFHWLLLNRVVEAGLKEFCMIILLPKTILLIEYKKRTVGSI